MLWYYLYPNLRFGLFYALIVLALGVMTSQIHTCETTIMRPFKKRLKNWSLGQHVMEGRIEACLNTTPHPAVVQAFDTSMRRLHLLINQGSSFVDTS